MEEEIPGSCPELKTRETNFQSQEFGESIANINPEEMNYYSSFIFPTFTLILIITCLVVALYSAKDFEDSLIPPYLIAAAIIMGLDLSMMIIQSVIRKLSNENAYEFPENSMRSKKIPKIMTIILFVGYFGLIIVGGLACIVFNNTEITSKDNATLSVTFVAVYGFIVLRAMAEIISFITLWMLNSSRNIESKKYEKKASIEMGTNIEASSPRDSSDPRCNYLGSQEGEAQTPNVPEYDQNQDEVNTYILPGVDNNQNRGKFDDVDFSKIEESKEPYSIEVSEPSKQDKINLENKMQKKKPKKTSKASIISTQKYSKNKMTFSQKVSQKFLPNQASSGGYNAVGTETPYSEPEEYEINYVEQESSPFKYSEPADEPYQLNKTTFDVDSESDLSSLSSNNKSF
ncbi:unnamed protein product [Blepharisma stoltei]|uniref:Transmembrane protein n=1 Tax=Blepharisma stoltei TaxID=1481888 RepID=A0AAU9IVT9_9CILI|nr:unnamed protein product [Blepharisma stoltei]